MSENVVTWPHPTKLDLPAERILNGALEVKMDQVVVIGFTDAGDWYFASSIADGANVIYHCTKAIHELHKIEDAISDGAA